MDIIGYIGGNSDTIGVDERDTAFSRLDDEDAYYAAVDEDYVKAIQGSNPKLPIKDNPGNKQLYDNWRAQFHRWVAWSQETRAAGIVRIDLGDVDAQCVRYHNEAKAYRDALAKVAGPGSVATPDIPEEKPLPKIIPSVTGGIVDTADAVKWGLLAIFGIVVANKLSK